ncbi:MAG: hypothetical protein ACKO8M_08445 [Microcystis panniformis]
MTITTEDLLLSLPLVSSEEMLAEISFLKADLERLFTSDKSLNFLKEYQNDYLKITEVIEKIRAAQTPPQAENIYSLEYQPITREFQAKYCEFLSADSLKKMAYYDNYLQGFIKLIQVKKIMLDASLKSTDKSAQYYHIYFGLTILSEIIIEKYIGYFPHNYLESFKMIAKAFLNDPSLQPEKTSQFKQVLISLKHTARAILWQIQEYENQETKPLNWTDFYTSNKSDTDQVQKQKNQPAIAWAKSRLEQLENLRKVKGWD